MSRYKDRVGQIVNGIEFLKPTDKRRDNRMVWEVKCHCGEIFYTIYKVIKNKYTTSCGCSRIKEMKGQIINGLEFLEKTDKRLDNGVIWKVRCYCGKIFETLGKSIRAGKTRSCGCLVKETKARKNDHHYYKDMTGQEINGIIFLYDTDKRKGRLAVWRLLCHCGKEFETTGTAIRTSHTKSCGCIRDNLSITDEERELYKRRDTTEIRHWRESVYNRDNYICLKCCQIGGQLRAHHLNGWHWCKEERFDINNGVTLCKNCHLDFHHQYGRKNNTAEQYISWFLHS